MKVLKLTPRVELAQRVIATRMLPALDQLASELEFPAEDISQELKLFTIFCTRLQVENGELDFELISALDTQTAIAEKFVAYLDSECLSTIEKGWALIAGMDRPVDSATAPERPGETEKN